MIKISQLVKLNYKPKDVAMFLGVTTRTLQNWDRSGKILFRRDPVSNRRFLTKEDVIQLLIKYNLLIDDSVSERRDVIYARVSSYVQKKCGDLDRQVASIINRVDDLQNLLVFSEVGSALNENRKKLQYLIKMVLNDEVSRLFITHEDRLTNCGFSYIEMLFKIKGVEIIIINMN